MDMHAAALPPIQPRMPTDTAHPLYRAYVQHRNFCANNLITATSWEGFVYQHEHNKLSDDATKHPQYPAFLAWMRETRAGARNCPAGAFPANFQYWLTGARW